MLAISLTTTELLEHNPGRFLSDTDVLSRRAPAPHIHREDLVDAQSACEDQLSGACRFPSRVSCRPDRQSSALDRRLGSART
jgi:hypothetical protein